MGIEPTSSAWEAEVLPLNYARARLKYMLAGSHREGLDRLISQSGQHTPPRSFVRRSGRITSAQKRALEELWPVYGIADSPERLSLEQVFGRTAPTVLEIGFGNGETLVRSAEESPDVNFLGIEVHRPGLGRCMLLAEKAGIRNLRLIEGDAVEALENRLSPAAFATVCLYFPDPWPRKRHHKRRLVQPGFVRLVERVLEPRGVFHVATDWMPYAEHIESVMSGNAAFERLGRPPSRYITRFERRGSALGHQIHEAAFRLRLQNGAA